MQLRFDEFEDSGLLWLYLIISGLFHFVRCVSFASQWWFVNKHQLIVCKLRFDVNFGIVVLFVLCNPCLHLRICLDLWRGYFAFNLSHRGSVSAKLSEGNALGWKTFVGPGRYRDSTRQMGVVFVDLCAGALYAYVTSCSYVSQSVLFWQHSAVVV